MGSSSGTGAGNTGGMGDMACMGSMGGSSGAGAGNTGGMGDMGGSGGMGASSLGGMGGMGCSGGAGAAALADLGASGTGAGAGTGTATGMAVQLANGQMAFQMPNGQMTMMPMEALGGGCSGMGLEQQATAAAGLAEGTPVSASELQTFIDANRLDDTAARNLRAEPAAIQRAVLDRGSLADCVNPSSALIGRIRDAKIKHMYSKPSTALPPASPPSAEVERFIAENRLDEMASQNLRMEPPAVQQVVMARGPVADCTNPSSALIGRIRDAKLQVKYGSGSGADPTPSQPSANASAVEQFMHENRLDEGARRALLAEPEDVQTDVMNRGPLTVCVNPSSAVMGRIRDAKKDRLQAASVGMGGLGGFGLGAGGSYRPY